ncbi:hypothetical protein ZWY2020_027789 [Hordeum vulgare]|nr:hypothetical protein ZWY2020_027789 [Hordeum vulgare]
METREATTATRETTPEEIAVPAGGNPGYASEDESQEILPRGTTARGPGDCCSAGGGSVQIGEGSRTCAAHRRWEVVFLAPSSEFQGDRQGFIILHLSSLWITIRDAQGDILAGRYLQNAEYPAAGQILEIDGFRFLVQEQSGIGNLRKESVSELSPPVRFGGRFWVLAEQDDTLDDEHDDGRPEVQTPEAPSPSTPPPSTELLQERKVRQDPVLARKKMEIAPRKPWIGPIPKRSGTPMSTICVRMTQWPAESVGSRPSATICAVDQKDNCDVAVTDEPIFIPKVDTEVAPIFASP